MQRASVGDVFEFDGIVFVVADAQYMWIGDYRCEVEPVQAVAIAVAHKSLNTCDHG